MNKKIRMIRTLFIAAMACQLSMGSASAQGPQKMSYQAVLRNSSDALVANTNVGMQVSILQGSAEGAAVYVERHFPKTNANGLVTTEIGSGTVISGTFAAIDWSAGPYFIKTETDINGGANYTVTGISQLLSVPYALYAQKAGAVELSSTQIESLKGANGLQGEQGPAGKDGAPGKDGADGHSTFDLWKTQAGNETKTEADYLVAVKGIDGKDGVDGKDGADGHSAFDLWKAQAGNETKTEADYLVAVKGIDGKNGVDGKDGIDGKDGADGAPGKDGANGLSAFELWSAQAGNETKTEADYLIAIKGIDGKDGINGKDGADGANGLSAFELWKAQAGNETKSEADFLIATRGIDGKDGADGAPGTDGANGLSAYELWKAAGNTGDNATFLASLKGDKGDKGDKGVQGNAGTGLTNKGDWTTGTMYAAGDYVFDRSSATDATKSMWICKTGLTSASNPYLQTANWTQFQAPAGPQGIQGLTGATGATGAAGKDGLTTSVNGVTQVAGAITLTKANIGLGNVDNTTDAAKPVSTATQTALATKVDKVTGKDLSTNDYTTVEKTKLAGIAAGAEVNVNADWTAITGDAVILNKPTTLAGYGIGDAVNTSGNQTIGGIKSFTSPIQPVYLEVTALGTGDRNSFIDFHGDDTNIDYSLRMIRWATGVNANSQILHRGTGVLSVTAQDAGSVAIQTNSITRMVVNPTGSIDVKNNLINNVATPIATTDAVNKAYLDAAAATKADKATTLAGYGIADAVATTATATWDKDASNDVTITGAQTITGVKTFTNGIVGSVNANNTVISNVATPVAATDAATKAYVDALEAKFVTLVKLQLNNGASVSDLLKAGVSISDLLKAGVSNNQLIGVEYQGGKIAYILEPTDPGYVAGETHGLIAAPSDQSEGIQWFISSLTTGATATALGTGNANTNTIVAKQGGGSYAAKLCADLVLGGYSDWYLPSKDELNKLYLNKVAVGGFASALYWSSTETSASYAFFFAFLTGITDRFFKTNTCNVRAVRAF